MCLESVLIRFTEVGVSQVRCLVDLIEVREDGVLVFNSRSSKWSVPLW